MKSYREKAKQRLESLVEVYRLLVLQGGYSGVELDKRILTLCVHGYLDDTFRYKVDHPKVNHFDHHKKAAFTIKWIVKLRPIQLLGADPGSTIGKMMINEIYALHAGLVFMKLHPDIISPGYIRHFIYNLRRCPVVAETLASEMYLLEQCVHGNPP
ncbi:MAG: hypothetical protein HQL82_01830 [Magnetococcales bacterium]|nr:hypothetical protein [Magnetococcales bacterium]